MRALGDAHPEQLTNGQARDAILCLINNERERRGLPALDRDKKLQKAAQRHNERMDGTGCFAHECPGEAALGARLGASATSTAASSAGPSAKTSPGGCETAAPRGRSSTPGWTAPATGRTSSARASARSASASPPGTPGGKQRPGGIYTTDFGLAIR